MEENRIIAGRYELITEWDRGGMSIVYLARDMRLKKNWAVKEILKESAVNGKKVSNDLLAEARLMKNLTHHTLPRIVDIVDQDDTFYIVMDFVEGDNLRNILLREGAQPQERVIRWGIELANVLDYLHHQTPPIIYRDMKPSNVMLTPDGTLKLIDFGIARTIKAGGGDDTTHLGTYGYAAPEQFERDDGPSRTDERTDVYDLGTTMYSLLTGATPETDPYFKLVPIRTIDPSLSAGLEKIIIKCTRPDPDDRYQSMEELIRALLNFEKLDDEFVRKKKRTLMKAALPVMLGLLMLLSSAGLFTANALINANTYESLLLETGDRQKDIENLRRAISLRPDSAEAYEKLCEKLATDEDGLTEDDARIIREAYACIRKVKTGSKEYLEINYLLGEDFLVYFTGKSDDSVRNRLINAEPFFRAVQESGKTDFEGYDISKAYVSLAEFYKTYIISSGSEFAKEAGKKQYRAFLASCSEVIESSSRSGNDQLKMTACDITLDMVANKETDLAGHIGRKKVTVVLDKAASVIEDSSLPQEKKEDLLSRESQIRKELDESYKNASKTESGFEESEVKE